MKLPLNNLLINSSRRLIQVLMIQVLACNLLFANTITGQKLSDIPITTKIENATIEQIFFKIENQTNFKFGYNKSSLDRKVRYSISKENLMLKELLLEVSKKANVKFRRMGNHILVSPRAINDTQKSPAVEEIQGKTITGKITDQNGESLIGATVMVKGTTIGTVTDLEGNFSLTVPQDAQFLVVSFLGYDTQEIAITESLEYNISLQEGAEMLENVVVVGYGEVKQKDLTTSITKVNINNIAKSRPANLGSLIQGRLPGVTIQSGGGDPLSGNTVSIRGRGSRGGDGVLYIVDGVPNAPFNVEDVEDVTVLKDAASAAIYGAWAGSGGVIIITTKNAREGDIKVSMNSYLSTSKVQKLPEVLDASEFKKVNEVAYKAIEKPLPEILNEPYFLETRTNWLDEVFREAKLQHYALSLSGGTEKLNAFASFSYDDNEGILINTNKKSIGTKLNVQFTPAKWIKIDETLKYQYANGQGGINTDNHQGILINSIFFPRSSTLYDYDRGANQMFDEYDNPLYQGTMPRWIAKEGISGFGEIRNPAATLLRLRQDRPSHKVYSTTKLQIMPINGLTLSSIFTIGVHNDKFKNFAARITEPGRPNAINSLYHSMNDYNNYLSESNIAYKTVVGDMHSINAMIGTTLYKEHGEGYDFEVKKFDRENERFTLLGNAKNKKLDSPSEYIFDESTTSLYGRVGYSFADRYFITASIRRDATSKLHPDNRAGIFNAISGSWKISSEPFFSGMSDKISLLKLRGSWGQIGNKDLVPRYSYNVALKNSEWETFFGDNLQSGFRGKFQSTIVNKDLTWETTEQIGAGLDVEFFNSLFVTLDYFDKKTKNLIEKLPVPSQAGIKESPYGNIGEVSNKGWEVGLKFKKNISNFNFELFGNFNTVVNTVENLGTLSKYGIEHKSGGYEVNSIYPLKSEVGQPWYAFHLIKTDGIFQNQEQIDQYVFKDKEGNSNKIQPNAKPGDLKYIDFNKDGQINDDDRQFMGSYLPKMTYAFGLNMEFKGVDLSFFFQGISGNKIFNGFKAMGLTGRGSNYMLKEVLKSWDFDKTSGIPKISSIEDSNGNYLNASDYFLEKGDYLRLKNITLGYTLPKSIMKKVNLRFYVNAENVFTFTDYSGFDPEVGKNGIDGGRYPVPRTISVGLNFNY